MNEEQKKQFLDIDLYGLFEIEDTATIEQIKKAYRKRALESHPDKNPNNKEEAEKKFVQLGKALEVLATPSSKSAYDAVRKSRKEKVKRDEQLDDKRRKLKDALEEREKIFKDKAQKRTEDLKKTKEEERYQNEVDRLRNEGSKLLEEEMNFINEQLRQEKKRSSTQQKDKINELASPQQPPRFKIKWPSKLDASKFNEELISYLFSKYGELEALVLSKKSSAIIEYKNLNDARKCLEDEKYLKETYSITLKWLGPNLNTPNEEVEIVVKNEVTEMNFEEMEMAILKKLKQAGSTNL